MDNPNYLQRNLKTIRICLVILTILMLGTVIVIGRDFIYPLCLAILFAYLIYPLVNFLERYIPYRNLATILSVLLAIIVVGGFIFFLYEQFSFFLSDLPQLEKHASRNLREFQEYLNRHTPLHFDNQHTLTDGLKKTASSDGSLLKKLFNATSGTLVGLGIQPVYVYFLLYYRHHFRKFLFKVTKREHHARLVNVLRRIADVTKNYVSGVFIVVLILCFLNSVGLWIIGIRYAIMFGIISAVMNFIPYFGTLIGASIPLLYALSSSEPRHAIGVLILFIFIQFLENNILTPTITGGRVAINPLFTIFTIIVGGLAWGIPGMFLFVPFLGIAKVVMEEIEPLKPIAYVISTRQKPGGESFLKKLRTRLQKNFNK